MQEKCMFISLCKWASSCYKCTQATICIIGLHCRK